MQNTQDTFAKKVNEIVRFTPKRSYGLPRHKLVKRICEDTKEFFEKGISTDGEELDFCSIVDLALDENLITNGDTRSDLLNRIYDASGFPRIWQG